MKFSYLFYLTFSLLLISSCRQTDITVVSNEAITVTQSQSPTTSARVTSQKLRIGELERIVGFDPLFSQHHSNQRVLQLIYEGLVGLDADGGIVPVLASKWEVSEDSLLYTFTLNNNARFQDSAAFIDGKGRAITSRDVYETFRRMTDPNVPPSAAAIFSDAIQGFDAFNRERRQVYISSDRSLSTIQGIQIIDNQTISFILTKQAKNFLELLASPFAVIYPPELSTRLQDQPIGSGPYRLLRIQSDTLVTLEKSSVYWNTSYTNTIQSVDFRRFRSDSDILRAVIDRQIDFIPETNPNSRIQLMSGTSTLRDEYKNDFNLTITEGGDYSSFIFNPSNGYGLNSAAQNLILQYVNPDSLRSLISQSGIEFVSWEYAPGTVQVDTMSNKDKFTIAFTGENANNYLARNIYYLVNNRLPLTLVRSNVISREITWAVLHQKDFISKTNLSNHNMIEIARFSNPRYAITNNLVNNLSLNTHAWWINLDKVNIRLAGNLQ